MAVMVGWATAELNATGGGSGHDRMTKLQSRGSSCEPLAEVDQGLGAGVRWRRAIRPLEQPGARCARVFKGGLEFPANYDRCNSIFSPAFGHDTDSRATSRAGRRGLSRLFHDTYLLVQMSHRVTHRLIEQGPDRMPSTLKAASRSRANDRQRDHPGYDVGRKHFERHSASRSSIT
jgi:hypothetical protein